MVVIIAVVAVGCAGLVVVFMALSVGAPNQATVRCEDDQIVVRPRGAMGLWSLSRGVEIPRSKVASVTLLGRSEGRRRFWRPPGMRLPGAYFPGVICAGTYRARGTKELWMVGRADHAVAIDVTEWTYTRVVVQVTDPAALVRQLSAAGSG